MKKRTDIRWVIGQLTSECATANDVSELRCKRVELFSFEVGWKAVDVYVSGPARRMVSTRTVEMKGTY